MGKILESENLRKSSVNESDDLERALLGNVLCDVLEDIIRYFCVLSQIYWIKEIL